MYLPCLKIRIHKWLGFNLSLHIEDSPPAMCKLEDYINQKLLQKNARKVPHKKSAEKLNCGKEGVEGSSNL